MLKLVWANLDPAANGAQTHHFSSEMSNILNALVPSMVQTRDSCFLPIEGPKLLPLDGPIRANRLIFANPLKTLTSLN